MVKQKALDINKLVQDELSKINLQQIFEDKLRTKLESTITGIVEDTFKEWGSFGKQLKEHIEKNLLLGRSGLDLTSYSEFVTSQAAEVLKSSMNEERAEKLKGILRDKLNIVSKQEINFEEFIKKIEQYIIETIRLQKEEDPCGCDENLEYTILCSQEDNGFGAYWEIQIYNGDKTPKSYSSDNFAGLSLNAKGVCYSSLKERNDTNLYLMFNSMAFNRTVISGIKYYKNTLTVEDTY